VALKDLIPWRKRGRDVEVRRGEESRPLPQERDVDACPRDGNDPLLSLHQHMGRLFDDAFRGFDLMPFGSDRLFDHAMDWPKIEVSETDQEVKVSAEVPGLEEKDLQVEFANGVLAITGEKKSETEDGSKGFSGRYYGRFERRIPIDDVDENNVAATFKNGVLTVTLRKTAPAKKDTKFI
jgi:HSP20 family protein